MQLYIHKSKDVTSKIFVLLESELNMTLFRTYSVKTKWWTSLLGSDIYSNPQSILPHAGNKCYEVKIEEREKAGSCRELNPGHLWLELPVLCHNSRTTTSLHNPLYVLHKWY